APLTPIVARRCGGGMTKDIVYNNGDFDGSPAAKDAAWEHWCYHSPWSPPTRLTQSSLSGLGNEPRIWLSTAGNVIAFGTSELPKGMDEIQQTARRVQAAIALFDGPARKGVVSLVGCADVEGGDRSDPIPAAYFDMPRYLDDADNSICTNLARLSESCKAQ